MTFKTSVDMFADFAVLPNLVPDMQPCLRTASYLLSLACSFNTKSWQTYPKSILLDGHLLFPKHKHTWVQQLTFYKCNPISFQISL